MKRLIRMLMVNWYRLEQQTINFEGHTAIIGPNASGKSSILDAIQVVLVGGHKEWWRPNASAGEKSTRSLRDYCLGVVRDPDNPNLSAEFKPRDQAITYLVLVFEEDGGERISVGLVMQARLSESSEHIDGRFIAPGADLLMSDLIDRGLDNTQTPKPWIRFKEELRDRIGKRLILETQAEKFQRQICAELSDGKRHLDRKRFLRAFRSAITFAPIKNVSDFVSRFILEERDIQVKTLQQALQNYREIKRKTEQALEREESLESINSHYIKAEQSERLAMSWRWVEQEAMFNVLEAELDPLREKIENCAAKIRKLAAQIEQLHLNWKDADDELAEANKRLSANNVAQQREILEAQKKYAEMNLNQAQDGINNSRRKLNHLHKLYDHRKLLIDTELSSNLNDLLPHLGKNDGALLDDWPLQPKDIESVVQDLQPLLKKELIAQRERRDELVTKIARMEEELTALRERVARLETGKSDLSFAAQQLIEMLSRHDIEATPLCDCVEVANENWRDALESFLGGHREALLVSPEKVREAISIYRREGRRLNIFGSRIINTLKTSDWINRRDENSLAEIIQSENEHAIAYINRRTGNVLRVDSENELLKHDRAITQDGMLSSGGSITRIKQIDAMLGRSARERTLELLKTGFLENSQRYGEIKNQREKLARFIDEQLHPIHQSLDKSLNLTQLCEQRLKQQQELRGFQQQLQMLVDDSAYIDLEQKVEKAKEKRESIDEQKDKYGKQLTDLKLAQQNDENDLKNKNKKSEHVAELRKEIEHEPGFDAAQASERLEELEAQTLLKDEGVQLWSGLSQDAEKRANRQTTSMGNQRGQAYDELREYMSAWSGEPPISADTKQDHLTLSAWVVRELTELRETALAQFTREAKTALDEAETAFRADFVGKLQDNLHQLNRQLDELNRNLKRRPFHGQYYRFIKNPDAELKSVLDWVESWSREDSGNVGGLFDDANDASHPHYEGIIKVRDLLMESGESGASSIFNDLLADYRQYYHFDVRMTDDSDSKKNAELLSRRIGKGSGGEHQSPFYVAIGASLAAAYRIERNEKGGYSGGMGLAVFDEAFSKLDLQNTVSALGFLDELGLQVLLAAPDEKYGQIAEHVDTIVNVYRDGGNVYIDMDHIKAAGRAALAVDNPVTQPVPSKLAPAESE